MSPVSTSTSIKARLEAAIQDGALTLSPALLAELGLELDLATWLDVIDLEVRDVSLRKRGKRLSLTGEVRLGGTAAELSASFSEKSGGTRVELGFALPAGWTLGRFLPAASGTLLDRLHLAEPSLTLRADGATTELELSADLHLDGVLGPVTELVGEVPPLALIAHLQPAGASPDGGVRIDGTARLKRGLSVDVPLIGPLKLGAPAVRIEFEELDGQRDADVFLEGTLELGRTKLPVTLALPEKDDDEGEDEGFLIALGADEPVRLETLGNLLKSVGGAELESFLPRSLRTLGQVRLEDLQLAYQVGADGNLSATFALAFDGAWDLVADRFSLSDVTLRLHTDRWERTSTISMGGALSGTLSLGSTEVRVHAVLEGEEWTFEADLDDVRLPGWNDLVGLLGGDGSAMALPAGLDVGAHLALERVAFAYRPQDRSLVAAEAEVGTLEPWELVPGAIAIEDVTLELAADFPFVKSKRAVTGTLSGLARLGSITAEVEVPIPGEPEVTLDFGALSLHGLIESLLPELGLPDGLPDLALEEVQVAVTPTTGAVSVSGRSGAPWQLPVGVHGLEVRDVVVALRRDVIGRIAQVSGELSGVLAIEGASFGVRWSLPGDLELTGRIPSLSLSPLLQGLCGGELLRELSLPVSALELELTDIAVSVAPLERKIALEASSDFGSATIAVEPATGGWGFSVVLAPPANWGLGRIDPALAVLDGLDFSGASLVLSSADVRDFELETADAETSKVHLKKGFSFFAALDARGTGVDELLGLESLVVSAQLDSDPRNVVIEAEIEGEFQLADNVAFGDIRFRLQPSPTEFAVSLLGTVTTIMDGEPLRFTGELGIATIATPPSFEARFAATMEGRWNEPFGAKGVAIMDVGLDLGVAFPPIRPSLGLAGGLQVGDFIGAAAVKIDTVNPAQSMLAVAFNRLYLVDVIKTFCPPAVFEAIPTSITTTVLDVGFEDVELYIVPQETRIGELVFEQGFTVKGTMKFWGLTAHGYLNIDQTRGVLVEGDIEPIDLGGVLTIAGSGSREKPYLHLDLRIGSNPQVEIAGSVALLGISAETLLVVSDTGFEFLLSGNLFELFEATLEVRGGNLGGAAGIQVIATLRNDLFTYLREQATAAIQELTEDAVRAIEDAQRTLTSAQGQVDNLNGTIDEVRATVRRERERDAKRLQDAQGAVQKEQDNVARIDRDIANMRRTVQGERDRDAKRLRDAQAAVQGEQDKVRKLEGDIARTRATVRAERERDAGNLRSAQAKVQGAQNDVNKLQGEIDSTKRRISQLNGDISNKKRWLDGKKWWDKSWAGIEYAAYAAAKGTEITALYAKIGGIEAAKHTALGVLELAKQSLRGMEAAATSIPIDMDPRIVGLFTALGTATGALEVAKQALRGMEAAAVSIPIDMDPRVAGMVAAREAANAALEVAKQALRGMEAAARGIPIDMDPRVAGLIASRETAKGVLEAAKFGLEGVKASVGAAAEVGQRIVEFGLGGLIDVRTARFEGELSAVDGGRVSLELGLTFLGEPADLALAFDFNDPLSGAKELAKALLPG